MFATLNRFAEIGLLFDFLNEGDGQPARPARPSRPLPPPVSAPEACLKYLSEVMALVVPPERAQEAALTFMRYLPGTVVRIPTMDKVEALARDVQITRRLLRDPSAAAVQHAADFHDLEVRDTAKTFKSRNGGKGLASERARRSDRPGLTCRVPRFNRWRRVVVC